MYRNSWVCTPTRGNASQLMGMYRNVPERQDRVHIMHYRAFGRRCSNTTRLRAMSLPVTGTKKELNTRYVSQRPRTAGTGASFGLSSVRETLLEYDTDSSKVSARNGYEIGINTRYVSQRPRTAGTGASYHFRTFGRRCSKTASSNVSARNGNEIGVKARCIATSPNGRNGCILPFSYVRETLLEDGFEQRLCP